MGELDLLRVDCPLAVCWVFGGGPRSVGDMLKLRTSRFLAAPGKKGKMEKWKNRKSSVKFINRTEKKTKRNEMRYLIYARTRCVRHGIYMLSIRSETSPSLPSLPLHSPFFFLGLIVWEIESYSTSFVCLQCLFRLKQNTWHIIEVSLLFYLSLSPTLRTNVWEQQGVKINSILYYACACSRRQGAQHNKDCTVWYTKHYE